jgi:20S proteasome subunit beta 6
VEIVKDCFISAGERNIHTGDSIEIFIITKEGLKTEVFALKAD